MIAKIKLSEKWSFETGPEVLEDFDRIKATGNYHNYPPRDPTDKEIEGLVWDIFGTYDGEDKLYVIAEYKDKRWAIRSNPVTVWPKMIDRCFFIDADDQSCTNEMSDKLFEHIKDEL